MSVQPLIFMRGCFINQLANELVPHFIAPAMIMRGPQMLDVDALVGGMCIAFIVSLSQTYRPKGKSSRSHLEHLLGDEAESLDLDFIHPDQDS